MIAKHCMLASRSKRPNPTTYGYGVGVLAEIWDELYVTTWFLGILECCKVSKRTQGKAANTRRCYELS